MIRETKCPGKTETINMPELHLFVVVMGAAMVYTGVIQWQALGLQAVEVPIRRAVINCSVSPSSDRLPPSAG